MRAGEFANSKLVIFDIDDTLVNTDTKVNVVKDGQVVRRLNSHDFTHYKLEPGEEFDFGAFRDAREFFANARPIAPMIRQLKQDIATGNKVIMVTARADFNDRDIFLSTFEKWGIDMSKVHVYRAGNIQMKVATEEKKKIILRHLLGKTHYDKVIMYDDAVPNLDAFLSLAQEYPWSKFYAWHVDREGGATEYHRSGITETIRKIGANKWRLYSKDGSRNLGTFNSLAAAKKHEQQVQAFKHMGEQAVAEDSLNEYRNALYDFVKSKFPTWPEYVLKDFLYAQAKGIRDKEELKDFLDRNQKDFGRVTWRLEKLPITLDVFTPKTQRMIKQREGGSSNPYQVPKDAERHTQQQKMIQQQGVSQEPIIVAKLSNGYDLIEGWHRTIQNLQAYPNGYTGPAWVGHGATYTSESKQGVSEGVRAYHGNQGGIDTEQLHAPMWFTASRPDAEHYAGDDGYVVVVDLDITNPYQLRPGEEANTILRRWQELQAQGYDGIYDRRLGDWIPFTREQIRVISKDDVMKENFADGKVKGKSRPGRVKRAGASCKGSVTDLRAKARKYSGERGKMYHWCANMKSGKKKNK